VLLKTTVSQTQSEFSSTILTWYISFRVTFRTSALGWIIWNFTKRGFVTETMQHTSLLKKICAPKTKTIRRSLELTYKKETNLKEKTQTFYSNRFKCLQSQCLISARIIYNKVTLITLKWTKHTVQIMVKFTFRLFFLCYSFTIWWSFICANLVTVFWQKQYSILGYYVI
jgi:hypothetical protein